MSFSTQTPPLSSNPSNTNPRRRRRRQAFPLPARPSHQGLPLPPPGPHLPLHNSPPRQPQYTTLPHRLGRGAPRLRYPSTNPLPNPGFPPLPSQQKHSHRQHQLSGHRSLLPNIPLPRHQHNHAQQESLQRLPLLLARHLPIKSTTRPRTMLPRIHRRRRAAHPFHPA